MLAVFYHQLKRIKNNSSKYLVRAYQLLRKQFEAINYFKTLSLIVGTNGIVKRGSNQSISINRLSEVGKAYRHIRIYSMCNCEQDFKQLLKNFNFSSRQRLAIYSVVSCHQIASRDELRPTNKDILKDKYWSDWTEQLVKLSFASPDEKHFHQILKLYQQLNSLRQTILQNGMQAKLYLLSERDFYGEGRISRLSIFSKHRLLQCFLVCLLLLGWVTTNKFIRVERQLLEQKALTKWLSRQSLGLQKPCVITRELLSKLKPLQTGSQRFLFTELSSSRPYQQAINRYLNTCVFKPALEKLVTELLVYKDRSLHLIKKQNQVLQIRLYLDFIDRVLQSKRDTALASEVLSTLQPGMKQEDIITLIPFFYRFLESDGLKPSFGRLSQDFYPLKKSIDKTYYPEYLYLDKGYKHIVAPVISSKDLVWQHKKRLLALYLEDYIKTWQQLYHSIHVDNVTSLYSAKDKIKQLKKEISQLKHLKRVLQKASGIQGLLSLRQMTDKQKSQLNALVRTNDSLDKSEQELSSIISTLDVLLAKQSLNSIALAARQEVRAIFNGCKQSSSICHVKRQLERIDARSINDETQLGKRIVRPFWAYFLSIEAKRLHRLWGQFLALPQNQQVFDSFPLNPYASREVSMTQLKQFLLSKTVDGFASVYHDNIKPLLDLKKNQYTFNTWLGLGVSFEPTVIKKLYFLDWLTKTQGQLHVSLYPLPDNHLKLIEWRFKQMQFSYRNGPQSWQPLRLTLLDERQKVGLKLIDVHNRALYHRYKGTWPIWHLLFDLKSFMKEQDKVFIIVKNHHLNVKAKWLLKSDDDSPFLSLLLSHERLIPLTL